MAGGFASGAGCPGRRPARWRREPCHSDRLGPFQIRLSRSVTISSSCRISGGKLIDPNGSTAGPRFTGVQRAPAVEELLILLADLGPQRFELPQLRAGRDRGGRRHESEPLHEHLPDDRIAGLVEMNPVVGERRGLFPSRQDSG